MKKIGLLIACMMFLSGCTATNGLVSKKDIDNLDYKEMNTMVEEQKDISYIPDDVKEFLKQVEEASKNQMETPYGYLDIKSSMMGYYGKNSEFLHEVYISEDLNDDEKVEVDKLIDALDQTISKGLKLYIDEFVNEDLKTSISNKIGRVWVSISPIDNYMDPEGESDGNSIVLMIKVKDIKDKEYKALVEDITSDDLILSDINLGREQNLIELSNVEKRNLMGYEVKKPSIGYQLFVDDMKIEKVRLSLEAISSERIDDNLKSLSNIADKMEFTSKDMKILEEIRTLIKENKPGKKTLASDKYKMNYRNIDNKSSVYGTYESTNLTEVVIETR